MTTVKNIQMVDLKGQYEAIQNEIDSAVIDTIRSGAFINGPRVNSFKENLQNYLGAKYVIPCANGTDALQIAMMALGLQPGDEVIVPAFTYVATAEVIGLLHLVPVMVEVDPDTFNLTAEIIEAAITPKTKAVVPVHLFGQGADMEPIMKLAKKHNIFVIEDNAQAIGATYTDSQGNKQKTGTIADVGTTSFYPSKNLGCYGDGGAMFTNDDDLGFRLRSIANHGQGKKKYYHEEIGCNSRLDAIQAAILDLKLAKLDEYCAARQKAAAFYDRALVDIPQLQTPKRQHNSTHVFHQYTLLVKEGDRDALKEYLKEKGVPSMVYYPVPLYKQEAFKKYWEGEDMPITEMLCKSVISLPMHTEMDEETLVYITETVKSFFK